MPKPTITVQEAENGIPTLAVCECGAEWKRPENDPYADTLAEWSRKHECKKLTFMGKEVKVEVVSMKLKGIRCTDCGFAVKRSSSDQPDSEIRQLYNDHKCVNKN